MEASVGKKNQFNSQTVNVRRSRFCHSNVHRLVLAMVENRLRGVQLFVYNRALHHRSFSCNPWIYRWLCSLLDPYFKDLPFIFPAGSLA